MMNSWRMVFVVSLLIVVGMGGAAFAEPLLTSSEPFSPETPEPSAGMLIEVQELSAPLEGKSDEIPLSLSDNASKESVDVKAETPGQTSETSVVPEPSTLLLVGLGLFGALWGLRRRKRG